ncbi:MAG: hypothetical protein ACI9MC_002163 [Kiritimatiellia bacterium]
MGDSPQPPVELPDRNDSAEDGFVAAWSASEDTDGLIEVVGHAIQARRPLLAARLVQLLPTRIEIEPGSDLERATRAASMLVVDTQNIELFNAMDDAWRSVRRRRMRRMMQRQKLRGRGEQWSIPRVGRKPRRR